MPSPQPTVSPLATPTSTIPPNVTVYVAPPNIQHITFSSDGKLWFTSNSQITGQASQIGFLDPSSGKVTLYPALTSSETSNLMENEITAGTNGSVWYVLNSSGCSSYGQCAASKINQITSQGSILAYSVGSVYGTSGITDITLGSDSNIYAVVQYGQGQNTVPAVEEFLPGATGPQAITQFPFAQGGYLVTIAKSLGGLVVGSVGGAFPSSQLGLPASGIWTFAGGLTGITSMPGPSNNGICGIVYASNTLWVVQQGSVTAQGGQNSYWYDQLVRYAFNGSGITLSFPAPSAGQSECLQNQQGSDQIAASQGYIYYPEGVAGKIARFNPYSIVSSDFSPGIGYIAGIAADSQGNIWAAGNNGKIAKISGF